MRTRRDFVQAATGSGMFMLAGGLRAAEAAPELVKAMNAVRAAIPKADADPARPAYHFHAPANWTNDPNGTIFYKGWHHLFFQLNPFASTIGAQHWGHARSRDLVNWEHLPIAIWPSSNRGERAIFSGAAIVASGGQPRILYTNIGHAQPEQWLAMPKDDDLFAWAKFPGNPVLTAAAHGPLRVNQWRDPFLFREGGEMYMVCGGSTERGRGGTGEVQLYRAANAGLSEWKYLGPVFRAMDRETFNIECPNLFRLDGKWVLIVSPHRPCEYYVGELDLTKVRFTPELRGVLDPGDAYASNISIDDQGRTLLWLWGRTHTPREKGWNSVMVMPRLLSIGPDGFLRQRVPPEFARLRGAPKQFPTTRPGEEPQVLDGIPGNSVEIEAELMPGSFGSAGLDLRQPSAANTSTEIAIERGTLSVGGIRTYVGRADRYRLRLFIDRSCIEVYVGDGVAAVYKALAPDPVSHITVFARAGSPPPFGPPQPPTSKVESLQAWPMSPARFDLTHFHIEE